MLHHHKQAQPWAPMSAAWRTTKLLPACSSARCSRHLLPQCACSCKCMPTQWSHACRRFQFLQDRAQFLNSVQGWAGFWNKCQSSPSWTLARQDAAQDAACCQLSRRPFEARYSDACALAFDQSALIPFRPVAVTAAAAASGPPSSSEAAAAAAVSNLGYSTSVHLHSFAVCPARTERKPERASRQAIRMWFRVQQLCLYRGTVSVCVS